MWMFLQKLICSPNVRMIPFYITQNKEPHSFFLHRVQVATRVGSKEDEAAHLRTDVRSSQYTLPLANSPALEPSALDTSCFVGPKPPSQTGER